MQYLLEVKGPDSILFDTVEYLLSEKREKQEIMLFFSCFETTGTTLVDLVGNYLDGHVQYYYSFSNTSVSLLKVQDPERDVQVVKNLLSVGEGNRHYQRVLQLLVGSTSDTEPYEVFLSGISFILFSDCASLLERVSQLYSLKIDPYSDPSRVLFYPFSTQNMNELVVELVGSALGGIRAGVVFVLINLQEMDRSDMESLVSFASSLCRIQNNPSRSLLKLQVRSVEQVVAHPRLCNLDARLNDSQLEIDQAKQRFGATKTRRPTPGSATWRGFLKSLKIMPSGESFRSNPTSPAVSPETNDDQVYYSSRSQYSDAASEEGRDLRYVHLTTRQSTFQKCFKCCLPKVIVKEFRSIFDVSESP